jgi:hypothetical protein
VCLAKNVFFGPTEIRILLILGNLTLLRSPYAMIFGHRRRRSSEHACSRCQPIVDQNGVVAFDPHRKMAVSIDSFTAFDLQFSRFATVLMISEEMSKLWTSDELMTTVPPLAIAPMARS